MINHSLSIGTILEWTFMLINVGFHDIERLSIVILQTVLPLKVNISFISVFISVVTFLPSDWMPSEA